MVHSFKTLTFLANLLPSLALAFTIPSLSPRVKCDYYLDLALEAADSLQARYFTDQGDYGPQAVWVSGVDIIWLNKLDQLAGTDHKHCIDTAFNSNYDYLLHGDSHGKSYDDVAWIVMAYLLHDDLKNALVFYDIQAEGLDDVCGGGVWWEEAHSFKNTITNVLFLSSSGLLWDYTKEDKYLKNLQNTWSWMKGMNLTNDQGLFNDGLTRDGSCKNDNGPVWTYNQATGLVGLAYLSRVDPTALEDAYQIIDNMIAHMTVDGILRENCETETTNTCNADQRVFKGLSVFFINWFQEITGTTKYSDFIIRQADAIVDNANMGNGYYGPTWFYPYKNPENWDSSQSSALAAFLAAAAQDCPW
ncbi:glycoside hydrolase family 76 protein [Flagelloscypha sp. PMI_526]|nr:glycoside hydrolase family 76 protein [Flagelloscypha sp. PMI_526]